MISVLKCTEIIKEFKLETYELKAKIKQAEIMSLLDMPSEALKVLEEINEKIQTLCNSSIKADYELVKAKVFIKLQRSLKSYGTPFYDAAVQSLKKARDFSILQCDLSTMREIYYLLSRSWQILGNIKERNKAAVQFLYADEELRSNSKNNLGYIWHFNPEKIIEETITKVDSFISKYSLMGNN